ncbi:D-alanyl-D-alanine carboxypeptidase [Desulfurella amilsii]|uniref:serine-type D-Ala-D-Ala carboxypeptidase n=1 Tax=Desulfurella amilsii TaxID=1562698 RepID=A0A1X4XX89_9BACT|nr:D-alanyl-D-alanine carboxypeptidase [Desulfurella amilsii]OSS42128.1 D-alanyl-D-alanine carboxypeptidase [Desulfurella amilsii]
MKIEKKRKKNKLPIFILILVVLVIIQMLRPIGKPKIKLAMNTDQTINGNLNILWPPHTQNAIAIQNEGLIEKTANQTPLPTASVAKIMTAYIILKDHPLKFGESGPTLTITNQDVQEYLADKAGGQSVVKVAAGEKLNERQMLEALLLPSANNIATLLARWDSGSVKSFVEKMNEIAKQLGMTNTHYADPAGISLNTQSSAYDQVLLAQKAFEIPTFRHIVGMAQASLPVCSTVYNVNYVLGKDGIVGIKTGSMPQIGANFVFAAKHFVGYKQTTIIGAIFGAQGQEPLMTALNGAITAINSTKPCLTLKQIIKKNQLIGTLSYPNGLKTNIIAKDSIYSLVWSSKKININVKIDKNLKLPVEKGQKIGNLIVNDKKVPILAQTSINKPTLIQKLTRL